MGMSSSFTWPKTLTQRPVGKKSLFPIHKNRPVTYLSTICRPSVTQMSLSDLYSLLEFLLRGFEPVSRSWGTRWVPHVRLGSSTEPLSKSWGTRRVPHVWLEQRIGPLTKSWGLAGSPMFRWNKESDPLSKSWGTRWVPHVSLEQRIGPLTKSWGTRWVPHAWVEHVV